MPQSTFYDLSANCLVSTKPLDRICALLQYQPGDIMEWTPDEDEPTFGKTDPVKRNKPIKDIYIIYIGRGRVVPGFFPVRAPAARMLCIA